LSDDSVQVTDVKLEELSNFLVFNLGEESHLNGSEFYFSFTGAICPEMQLSANPPIV
jgi:hypothetical protein